VVSKFVPGFSTVAPPIAGALRMSIGAFVLASLASAGLWVGFYLGVGYLFTQQIDIVLAWMTDNFGKAALIIALALGAYIGWKALQRWRLSRFVLASRISIDELKELMIAESRPFLVDVGSRIAQQSRPHIPGAVMLDLDDIAGKAEFPADRDIVLYCACPNEASAKRAAQILLKKGFKRVRPLIGGLDGWIAAGHPVEHGVAATFVKPAKKTHAKAEAA